MKKIDVEMLLCSADRIQELGNILIRIANNLLDEEAMSEAAEDEVRDTLYDLQSEVDAAIGLIDDAEVS